MNPLSNLRGWMPFLHTKRVTRPPFPVLISLFMLFVMIAGAIYVAVIPSDSTCDSAIARSHAIPAEDGKTDALDSLSRGWDGFLSTITTTRIPEAPAKMHLSCVLIEVIDTKRVNSTVGRLRRTTEPISSEPEHPHDELAGGGETAVNSFSPNLFS